MKEAFGWKYILFLDIKEDMLNPQAYSTNSMTELSSIMSNAIENRGCNETQIAKDKKRAKNKSEVRIICYVFKKEVIGD